MILRGLERKYIVDLDWRAVRRTKIVTSVHQLLKWRIVVSYLLKKMLKSVKNIYKYVRDTSGQTGLCQVKAILLLV